MLDAGDLAEYLFGDESRLVRLDMSEFQEPAALARLVGEPGDDGAVESLVHHIRKQPFAVVVLDVKMRGHDGFWACDEIRKKNPLIPIIFFSAFQDAKNPYDIINDHRPFAYIMKDGEPSRLLSAIGNAVSHYLMVQVSRRLSARFGKQTPGR